MNRFEMKSDRMSMSRGDARLASPSVSRRAAGASSPDGEMRVARRKVNQLDQQPGKVP
jgi:hypothetical protein